MALRVHAWAAVVLGAVVAGCGSASNPDDQPIESLDGRLLQWVSPLVGDVVAAGDAFEVSVYTQNPGVVVVHFAVDGTDVDACDPTEPDQDCVDDQVWTTALRFDAPGNHVVTAYYLDANGARVAATRQLTISPASNDGTRDDPSGDPNEADPFADDMLVFNGTDTITQSEVVVVPTGDYRDPDSAFHGVFGGIQWRVQSERVVLHDGRIDGPVRAIQTCWQRYGTSIARYAGLNYVSYSSLLAAAYAAGDCDGAGGDNQPFVTALVHGQLCSRLAPQAAGTPALTAAACRGRMRTNPDFGIMIAASYLGQASIVRRHHHDPPRTAAVLGVGNVRNSTQNPWHMRSRGDYIDRFVAGYNAARTAAHGPALGGFFPIAADYQRTDSFDAWQRRNVNTVIRVPDIEHITDAATVAADIDAWTTAANNHQFHMIRPPRANPADDVHETRLLAWEWIDEPEYPHNDSQHMAMPVPPAQLASFVGTLHAAAPTMPVMVNFWGGWIRNTSDACTDISPSCAYRCNGPGDGSDEGCYPSYIQHADWVSEDYYPCNFGMCNVGDVGRTLDKLRGWSGGRPAFAYIETGAVSDNTSTATYQAPSRDQFRGEVWDAIIHGARGIFYYPHHASPSGDIYDGTTPGVSDEMTTQNHRILALADTLQGVVNPGDISLEVHDSLEAGWRHGADGDYFFVLNLSATALHGARMRLHNVQHPSNQAADVDAGTSLPIAADDSFADDFTAYGVHVYRVQ